MKIVSRWSLCGLLLAALLAVTSSVATGQSPVTLSVYDPTGAFEVTQTFAPRAADLNRKIICEVSNDGWEATRMFPLIRSLLKDQFPTISFINYDQFPTGIMQIDVNNIGDLVKAKGCQAVVVGNAG
ncbi:MAG: hypothetical protein FWE89_05940 [Syntrophaceae bacterium]|nr:hypothetical protein [Syntrophaceae bacterium]